MDNNEAIKLAAKLAEPFEVGTFARISGLSESDASNTLATLQSMAWLDNAGYGSTGPLYKLSQSARQGISTGSFGY